MLYLHTSPEIINEINEYFDHMHSHFVLDTPLKKNVFHKIKYLFLNHLDKEQWYTITAQDVLLWFSLCLTGQERSLNHKEAHKLARNAIFNTMCFLVIQLKKEIQTISYDMEPENIHNRYMALICLRCLDSFEKII